MMGKYSNTTIKYSGWMLLLYLCTIVQCSEETPPPEGSLSAYLNSSNLPVSKQLIACAAGGQKGFLEDPSFPVSVFFLPIKGAYDFVYFENKNISDDQDDLDNYRKVDLEVVPVFNGFLQRFLHPGGDQDVWSKVVYRTQDSIHICNAIRLKSTTKPSEFNPQLVAISFADALSPKFSWQDGSIAENAIFFQVVSDADGYLLSGTYTYEKCWQFYNLDNVVLNVNDIVPEPTLDAGETYHFTLMGVSLDNWVNLISQNEFIAR